MPFVTGAELIGREKGLAEGLAEGLAKGRQEARKDLLAGIEGMLEVRFGAAGIALLAEVQQIEELNLLRGILQATKNADSPETLRQLWAKS